MHEKRLTSRLVSYWERMKKDEFAPKYSHLNPSIIDDIWQKCLVLEVQPTLGEPNFMFVHCGEEIATAMGANFYGEMLGQNKSVFPASAIVKRATNLFDMPQLEPIHDEGQFVNPTGKIVKYRSCLLAFANNENSITHVLAGVSWRVF